MAWPLRGLWGVCRGGFQPATPLRPLAQLPPCLPLWLLVAALILPAPARGVTVFSRSGQFVVQSRYASASSLSLVGVQADSGRVVLQPEALAVGCERVKAALLSELGLPDQWRGKIHVKLRTATAPDQLPVASASQYSDGWHFALVTPDELRPEELVRSLVMVLLLELADRVPGPYGAEMPLWLSEGLTAEVLAQVGPDLMPSQTLMVAKMGGQFGQLSSAARLLVLSENPTAVRRRMREQGEWGVGVEVRGANRADTRQRMREQGALTFEELSLPVPAALRGDAVRRYRDSAQAFLNELRALPDGDRLLREMLGGLTRCLNWQTAFLAAYHSHFKTLLEVEKWWALASNRFATEGTGEIWPASRAAAAMNEVLSVTVATMSGPGVVSQRERLSLTESMTRLDLSRFARLIGLKQRQFGVLAIHSPPELASLCQEYGSLLTIYLGLHNRQIQEDGGRVLPGQGQQRLLDRLAHSLEGLDRRWAVLESQIRGQAGRSLAASSQGASIP